MQHPGGWAWLSLLTTNSRVGAASSLCLLLAAFLALSLSRRPSIIDLFCAWPSIYNIRVFLCISTLIPHEQRERQKMGVFCSEDPSSERGLWVPWALYLWHKRPAPWSLGRISTSRGKSLVWVDRSHEEQEMKTKNYKRNKESCNEVSGGKVDIIMFFLQTKTAVWQAQYW